MENVFRYHSTNGKCSVVPRRSVLGIVPWMEADEGFVCPVSLFWLNRIYLFSFRYRILYIPMLACLYVYVRMPTGASEANERLSPFRSSLPPAVLCLWCGTPRVGGCEFAGVCVEEQVLRAVLVDFFSHGRWIFSQICVGNVLTFLYGSFIKLQKIVFTVRMDQQLTSPQQSRPFTPRLN